MIGQYPTQYSTFADLDAMRPAPEPVDIARFAKIFAKVKHPMIRIPAKIIPRAVGAAAKESTMNKTAYELGKQAAAEQFGEGSTFGDIMAPALGAIPIMGAPLAGYASGKTTPLSPGGVGAMTTAGTAAGQAAGGLGGAAVGAGLGALGNYLAKQYKPEWAMDYGKATGLGAALGGGLGMAAGGAYGAHQGRQVTEEAAKQETMEALMEQQQDQSERMATMEAIQQARIMGRQRGQQALMQRLMYAQQMQQGQPQY